MFGMAAVVLQGSQPIEIILHAFTRPRTDGVV